ncbi:hypothetical protein [Actinoplanes sp. NPDC048796]|uniref:hypothetical protein n=1 Tax=unclassified Actinoplanes TaxID=2626549 RepID=UPI0033CFA50C
MTGRAPGLSGLVPFDAFARGQVEHADQGPVLVDGVVQVAELAGLRVRARGADELPHAVVFTVGGTG